MSIPASLSDRLHTQHLSLQTLLKGLDNDRLEFPVIAGKWSIRDNIAHLTRYQPLFMNRIQSIVTGNEPVFESYRAENDPEFELWLKKNTAALIQELNADRKTLTDLLNQLNEKELTRYGIHPKFGRLSVLD